MGAPTTVSALTWMRLGAGINPPAFPIIGGYVIEGGPVELTLQMNGPVDIDTSHGSPTLALNNGGTATYFVTDSDPANGVLAFSYGLGFSGGNPTPALVVDQLNLNGAIIKDSGGFSPDFSSLGSLNLHLSVVSPLQVIAADWSVPFAHFGDTVQLTLTMSEAFTIIDKSSPTLALFNGGIGTLDFGASDPSDGKLVFDYVVDTGGLDPLINGARLYAYGPFAQDAAGYNADFLNIEMHTALRVTALTKDFDADGTADVLWRNDDGGIAIWQMHAGAVEQAHFFDSVPSSWHILGTGDFNSDGRADVLWQNDDGTLLEWQMANSAQIATEVGLGRAPANSTLVGLGDFYFDLSDQLLWRDNNTGVLTIENFSSFQTTISGIGLDWRVVGTGNFGGDGRSDIMFHNTTSGVTAAYISELVPGDPGSTTTVFYPGVSSDWHVAGIGDFDGDGVSDLLWRNDSGANAIWLFDSQSTIKQTAFLDGAGIDWHPVGVGDFNGDHKDDVLWQNDNGAIAVWQMNGASEPTVEFLNGVPAGWHSQADHYA